jgi:hypothetical protein
MRKINVTNWEVKNQDGSKSQEGLIEALNILVSMKKPEELPRGLDKFRLFSRLANAFDKAKETNILTLEESDYSFLKNTIENDIPSIWGMNRNIMQAIEEFLSAVQE